MCTKASRQTELTPYGVGIALYFQFLKHMVYTLLLLSFMSLPAYSFYFSGNKSGINLQTLNVKNLLTAFSIGNIGQCKRNTSTNNI